MRVVSFTKARNNLKSVLDTVAEDNGNCTVITRRDAEDAVVMSLDHYNGLMETLYLMQSPANAEHLRKSIEQYRAGKVVAHPLHDA
jgi:antitoxin YefM